MATFHIKTPADKKDVADVRIRDTIYIDGFIAVARDQAHKALLEKSEVIPNLVGLPIFHCGPIARKEDDEWMIVAGGPTTSTRMDALQPSVIAKYKTPIVIGKGGLGRIGKQGLAENGAIYAEFTGGASALAVSKIVSVKKRLLEELGPTELIWIWDVKDFGPLLVTQDHQMGDLKEEVTTEALRRIPNITSNHIAQIRS